MIKSILQFGALPILLSACSGGDHATHSNLISIGKYSFQFPKGFELITEQGIDSYVGKISNGDLEFQFDYGYYSNQLTPHVAEYLSEEHVKWNALGANGKLLQGSDLNYLSDQTDILDYTKVDSNKYELTLVCESDTFQYTAQVPAQISQSQIEIDTIDHVIYKFVNGPEYSGLYAKDLKSFNKSMNAHTALSITVNMTPGVDSTEIMNILKSCHYNRKKT